MEISQPFLFIGKSHTTALVCQSILTRNGFSCVLSVHPEGICGNLAKEIDDSNAQAIIMDTDYASSSNLLQIRQVAEIALNSHIPLMLAIAQEDTESISVPIAGVCDFILKPLDEHELCLRLTHLASIPHLQGDAQTDELKRTIEARDKLYSNVAHDLRSPIASIKMLLKIILTKMGNSDADPKLLEMIEMCDKTSENIFLLLDNLLKWVRVKADTLSMDIAPNNIIDIIENVMESMRSVISSKHLSVMFDIADGHPNVLCDAESIKVVVRNLLSNAVKFSHEGSAISVVVRHEGERVVVGIKDNGVGISSENTSKIFNETVHFSTFGTDDEDGSGLGLILSQNIVRKNGGSIWFESEEGKGSQFCFSLPFAE